MLQELFYWSWYVFLSSCNLKKLFFSLSFSIFYSVLVAHARNISCPEACVKIIFWDPFPRCNLVPCFLTCFFFSKRGNLCYVGLEAVDAKSWERNSLHFFPQVIAINNQFPGPLLNVTTNQNVRVNVQNNLDEPLLIIWYSSLLMPLWSLHFPAADLN